MKNKFLIFALLLSASVFAQKGAVDGSQFGKGEDSIRCVQNLTYMQMHYQAKNYADAYEFWHVVYTECPRSSLNIYIMGPRIIGYRISQEKDAAKQAAMVDLLMQVYDNRIKYYGNSQKYPGYYVLGRKALEYINYKAQVDPQLKKPYQWLKQSIEEGGVNSELNVLLTYVNVSENIYKNDDTHKVQFIEDYVKVSDLLGKIVKSESPEADQAKQLAGVIDGAFAASGAADCDMIQKIYGPKVEENKTNIEFLKGAISLMGRLKCQETDAFEAASNYAYKLEPSAESAWGCAIQAIKRKEVNQAIQFMEAAIRMETDNDRKADFYLTLAKLQVQVRRYSVARDNALKAADLKSGFGEPYVLIAQMYGADAANLYGGDPVLMGVVFCLAVDKLNEAKRIDPSLADQVNQMIRDYSAHYPQSQDVFMHNAVNAGSSFRVGGWINESTTVRVR